MTNSPIVVVDKLTDMHTSDRGLSRFYEQPAALPMDSETISE